ncbi:MAG TPA: hypothetical protein VHP11_14675 [Tepidisphaeraceae bacterium]|nr:hypothetical protein [Tepidisphaeraceae bacterium]
MTDMVAHRTTLFRRFWLLLLLLGVCLLCAWPLRCSSDKSQVEEILGSPLPANATDLHVLRMGGGSSGDDWVSVSMKREDFTKLMNAAGLMPRRDLMDYWPGAFDKPRKGVNAPWWSAAAPAAGTAYFLRSSEGLYAAKYENGRLYLRRERA